VLLLPVTSFVFGLRATPFGAWNPSADFEKVLEQTRWIDYAPTNYNPETTPVMLPSEASVREDMRVLRSAGFDGLITYAATLPVIVKVAQEEGFRSVLLGVWDPASAEELRLAKESAANPVVAGIIVGNEGLTFRRYDFDTLRRAMEQLRRDTGKPVSTTEVVEYFYTSRNLVESSDFLTVNAHPYFHGHRDPVRAVDWTLGAWCRLKRHVPDKPILFKEVGLPTEGASENDEAYQRAYYRQLLTTTDVQFAFFEAFDTLFKAGAVEQRWGLFRSDRSPKAAALVLSEPDLCSGPLLRVWCSH
jgi:exo-beta-1,3-glucanase (GH17 family)